MNFLLQRCASPVKSGQSRHKTKGIHQLKRDFHKRGISRSNANPSTCSVRFNNPPKPCGTRLARTPAAPSENLSLPASAVCRAPIQQVGKAHRSSAPRSNVVMFLTWASFRLTLGPGLHSQSTVTCLNYTVIPKGKGMGRGLSSCGEHGALRPREPLSESTRSLRSPQGATMGTHHSCWGTRESVGPCASQISVLMSGVSRLHYFLL